MNDLKGIIEDCNKSDLVSKEAIKKVIEIIGQEEWNDLYDGYSNICTTMGELIITLKGIADIEKENKELKTIKIPQLERRIASIRGAHSVDCRKLNARTEQVERLKKENAELKKQQFSLRNERNTFLAQNEQYEKDLIDFNENLTKAKEIIKGFLEANNGIDMFNAQWNAEQFLKEVSE